MSTTSNVDPLELARFEELAARWWDPRGQLGTLHDINPVRLAFIAERAALEGRRVVDVGCGGGLLAEAMAGGGARVVGIDASEQAVAVARLHAEATGTRVEYRQCTAETLSEEEPGSFDVVACMELLEHVPDPASLVTACARLAAPGGAVFFSTLNRHPRAWVLAVVGAEYLLGLLPRGTHDYARFLRPSELDQAARGAGLRLEELAGMAYDPFARRARLTRDVRVNYLTWYRTERAEA